MLPFLEWVEQTGLAIWVGESLYGYPFLLGMHAVGLAVVVGLAFVTNLGQLKVLKGISPELIVVLIRISWVGLIMNLLSGFALFSSQATYFVTNTPFLLKLVLIIAGAACLAATQRRIKSGREGRRLVAYGSLFFWVGAIVSGRLIAYF